MPDQRELAAILLKRGYNGSKKIGEGSFGVAVLVQDSEANNVVCKVVDVSKATSKDTREARREGRLLSQVKHPYIVRYRENFAERGWLCIVMDFCDGGDLMTQIEGVKKKRVILPEQKVLKWFTQSVLAMKYLHGKHILHRDLKPSNIFLMKTGDIRIGDFGISKVMECTNAFAKTFVGTPYYLAPEVISEKPYAWPADVWAMGCILYHLCARKVPFEASSLQALGLKVCKSPTPAVPDEYSEPLRDLQISTMNRVPASRPKFDDVLQNALIQCAVRTLLQEAEKKEEKATPIAKYEVLDQFSRFDQNGDGVIDRQELGRVLKHLDAKVWTDAKVSQIMSVADTNQDGRIQFEEFVNWIFGGGDQTSGIQKKLQELISLANVAVSAENLDALLENLTEYRQYVDMGCFRVLPPGVCIAICEALSWLAVSGASLLEESETAKAYDTLRQARAILESVERLLGESTHQHLQRVGVLASRSQINAICFERTDGGRFVFPANLESSAFEVPSVIWEKLQIGERIVEAKGFGMPPSKGRRFSSKVLEPTGKDTGLCANLTLVTNQQRQLEFGNKLTGSLATSAFTFKANAGEEIELVNFAEKTCNGVRKIPIVVNWPPDKVANVRSAFDAAVAAVWPLLVSIAFRMGSKYGKYSMLEGRRLGLRSLSVPAGVILPSDSFRSNVVVPPHWSVSDPRQDVTAVSMSTADVGKLQQILGGGLGPGRKQAKDDEAILPKRLQVVRASRLQNWTSWSSYSARVSVIREYMQAVKSEQKCKDFADPVRAAQMVSSGLTLETQANCRWLFHALGVAATQTIMNPDFDIDTAGAEDGMIYGRGIYHSEHAGDVDKNAAECPNGLRCMLLCRVALGNVLEDTALLPDKAQIIHSCTGGDYHSVVGDRSARSPGSTRDFVVYDKDQVYPEILIWYRRVY